MSLYIEVLNFFTIVAVSIIIYAFVSAIRLSFGNLECSASKAPMHYGKTTSAVLNCNTK